MKTLPGYIKRGAAELGINITSEQLEKFTLYANELCKWNRKINLTSIILPEDIAVKHFLDSLTLLKHTEISGALLDIGSGAGFPGVPLKIMLPSITVVSVDAVEKKINFQRHVARTLGLNDFTALHCRVEKLLPEYKDKFDCVVSRAFADIPKFVSHALPLLAENGVIIAMKGREGIREGGAAFDELKKLGAEVTSTSEFELPIMKDSRTILVIRRVLAKK